MNYLSTRGQAPKLNFGEVLLEGLAVDGGLYMPFAWPQFSSKELKELAQLSYTELAFKVIKPFIGDELTEPELKKALNQAISNFHHQAVAPLVQIDESIWLMELFHGPTLSFKDHALQLLGPLFKIFLARKQQRVTIIGATSGDTGSAAIEAFKNNPAVDVFILHPQDRISEVQRRQMTTVDRPNIFNIALNGDFDDCQAMVKLLFQDETLRRELNLSAVNSINWARIMAQIVYYFKAALLLGSPHKKPCFVVPTGNFGNIFAGFAAHQMGLPISKLVIASNVNDLLPRFLATQIMSKHKVQPSLSPAMDIQVSSNFERLLFELYNRNAEQTAQTMSKFAQTGQFHLENQAFKKIKKLFASSKCDDQQTKTEIKRLYQNTGLLIDPHTAAGTFAAQQLRHHNEPLIVLATAHPAKFSSAVQAATGINPPLPDCLKDLFHKKETYITLDKNLDQLKKFIKNHAQITKGKK